MASLKLMNPLTIRETTIPNRIVFPPIQTNYAAENGEATDRLIRFHKTIAQNNVGLSIIGATGISPFSKIGDHALCLYEKEQISSVEKLFKAIKEAGSVPAIQLNHGGRVMNPDLAGGKLVGPSAVPSPATGNTPHELSAEEVQDIIDNFVQAAVNAKNAGAEMVEFHGAHCFLLNQFLSPLANQRKDQYGGSTENRARIVKEILRKAREKVGDKFIIGLRMSVEECVDGGLTVDESSKMVKMFVDESLDIIHVSAGGLDLEPQILTEVWSWKKLVNLAGDIKKQVDIPVIAVGGILSLNQAESVIEEGLADMVAMGRSLVADPELVTKTLNGKLDEIDECTYCLQCFAPSEDPGMTCSVNENL
ncbi:MAG: NADH:flavin oxidoreductase [Desulfobacterales bacterium]|nr:NADH:flavin oxidoreductase [Desulfobacterales bacterium]